MSVPADGPGPAAVRAHLRRLGTHSAVYTLGMALARLASLAMIPLYTRALNPAQYGVLELVDTAELVIVVIVSAALTDPLLRFFTQAPDATSRARVVSTLTLTILGVGALMSTVGVLGAPGLSRLIFHASANTGLLRLALASVAFQAVIEVPLALFRAKDRSALWVTSVLGRHVLGLGLNVLFLLVYHLGVYGIVLSQLASSTVVSALLVVTTLRRYGTAFDLAILARVARFGWPLIPGALALIGLQHTLSYVLNAYGTLSDVGVWSTGFKFGITVTLVLGQPLRNAWSAQMYTVWASPDGPRTYARTGTVIVATVLAGATGLSALSREIIAIFATPAYARAALVIPAVAFGFALRELADYFRNGLFVGGDTRAVAWIEPALAVFDLALGIVLVRHWGLVGAIATSPLVFGLYALAMHHASRRVLPVSYEYAPMAALAGLALGLSGVCLWLHPRSLALAVGIKLAVVSLYPIVAVALVFRAPGDRLALRALRRRVVGW